MRTYLVSGFLYLIDGSSKAGARLIHLQDDELMDAATLPEVQAHALASFRAEFPDQAELMVSFVMTSFQALELPPHPLIAAAEDLVSQWREGKGASVARTWADSVQLNACDVIMPPVESPLLIEIAPGVLLKATRPTHADRRGDELVFDLEAGGQYIGRPRWTHP